MKHDAWGLLEVKKGLRRREEVCGELNILSDSKEDKRIQQWLMKEREIGWEMA